MVPPSMRGMAGLRVVQQAARARQVQLLPKPSDGVGVRAGAMQLVVLGMKEGSLSLVKLQASVFDSPIELLALRNACFVCRI